MNWEDTTMPTGQNNIFRLEDLDDYVPVSLRRDHAEVNSVVDEVKRDHITDTPGEGLENELNASKRQQPRLAKLNHEATFGKRKIHARDDLATHESVEPESDEYSGDDDDEDFLAFDTDDESYRGVIPALSEKTKGNGRGRVEKRPKLDNFVSGSRTKRSRKASTSSLKQTKVRPSTTVKRKSTSTRARNTSTPNKARVTSAASPAQTSTSGSASAAFADTLTPNDPPVSVAGLRVHWDPENLAYMTSDGYQVPTKADKLTADGGKKQSRDVKQRTSMAKRIVENIDSVGVSFTPFVVKIHWDPNRDLFQIMDLLEHIDDKARNLNPTATSELITALEFSRENQDELIRNHGPLMLAHVYWTAVSYNMEPKKTDPWMVDFIKDCDYFVLQDADFNFNPEVWKAHCRRSSLAAKQPKALTSSTHMRSIERDAADPKASVKPRSVGRVKKTNNTRPLLSTDTSRPRDLVELEAKYDEAMQKVKSLQQSLDEAHRSHDAELKSHEAEVNKLPVSIRREIQRATEAQRQEFEQLREAQSLELQTATNTAAKVPLLTSALNLARMRLKAAGIEYDPIEEEKLRRTREQDTRELRKQRDRLVREWDGLKDKLLAEQAIQVTTDTEEKLADVEAKLKEVMEKLV